MLDKYVCCEPKDFEDNSCKNFKDTICLSGSANKCKKCRFAANNLQFVLCLFENVEM